MKHLWYSAALALWLATPAAHADEDAPAPEKKTEITDEDAKKIAKAIKDINSKVEFGLSVGLRVRTSEETVIADAKILPTDGTLRAKEADRLDTVVSVVFAAFPFEEVDWLGFVANVDVVSYGPSGGLNTAFNRSVEGGIGLAWRPSSSFGFAGTIERYTGRVPRDGLAIGQPVIVRDQAGVAQPLASIDIDDDTYFQDESLTGLSLKFVYFFD